MGKSMTYTAKLEREKRQRETELKTLVDQSLGHTQEALHVKKIIETIDKILTLNRDCFNILGREYRHDTGNSLED